jgi:serpin B
MNKSKFISLFLVFIIVFSSAACSGEIQTTSQTETADEMVEETEANTQPSETPIQEGDSQITQQKTSSSLDRISSDIPPSDLQMLAGDMNVFAVNLLKQINNSNENQIFSPYSISLALTMAYAGADGKTADEMKSALNFNLPQEELHKQLNALDQSLYVVPEYLKDQEGSFQLNIANSLWGQSGFPFKQSYFDLLAQSYGAGLHLVNFANNSEQARVAINDWVSDATEEKIKDLIPSGGVNNLTRFVIANAIYFNAAWLNQFSNEETRPDDFYLADGSKSSAQMMQIEENYKYQRNQNVQLVEMPYLNDRYSMVLVMPLEKDLTSMIETLTNEQINDWLNEISGAKIILRMPKFKFESSFSVNQALKAMGMETAFSPTEADFSRMVEPDGERLFISEVIHKAYVDVDEEGTEAAAATAIVMRASVAQPDNEPPLIEFNHPFLFLIRDRQSGLILFVGKVTVPAA